MFGSSRRGLASIVGAALLTLAFTPVVVLAAVPPGFTSASGATFIIGAPNTFTIQTTGSTPMTITASGPLPSGVTFADTGRGTATLSGTPATGTSGTYSLVLTASNRSQAPAVQYFTLSVGTGIGPQITSTNTATFAVGFASTFTVRTSGTPTPTITESGSLPSGVAFGDNGNGTATLSGTPALGTGGTYTLTITASNVAGSSNQTFSLVVSTGVNHLVFTGQPSNAAAGALWNVQVAVENASNAVVSDGSTIYLSIGTNPVSPVNPLSCTGGMSEPTSGGYAYFSGCSISVGSASYYTLYATSSLGATAATSTPFYIGTGVNHLVFTGQPSNAAAGALWNVQVAVENASNAVVSDGSTIYLSIGTNPVSPVNPLSCTGGMSEPTSGGYAYFSGCSISVGSASYYTLYATSSLGATAATSTPFYIGTGVNHLVFTGQPSNAAAGALWNVQVAVENASNAVVSDGSTIYLSIGTNPVSPVNPLSCTGGMSEPTSGGYAYFSGCSISVGSASYYTLYATSSLGATAATSTPFYIGGARSTVTLSAASALGLNPASSSYSTATKLLKPGQSITIRVQSSPQLAGTTLGVWIAIKGANGTWSAYKPHASVTTDGSGTAYYTYTFGSKAWLAFRLYYGGGSYAPAWSYPSQFGRAL